MTAGDPRNAHDKHLAARANTLRWADEAAAGGDYGQALDWLAVLDAIGDELPPEYRARGDEWRTALRAETRRSEE